MIIIHLMGGIGNQLFQYALYSKLEKLGKDVKIDDSSWTRITKINTLELQNFGIEYKKASKKEIKEFEDNLPTLLAKIKRKLFGRKAKIYEEKSFNYDPNVFDIDDVCLIGYWQTDKYFADIRPHLLKTIQLSRAIDTKNKAMLDRIRTTNAVSVHVRRGDYETHNEYRMKFGNICTDVYYDEAIRIMREKTNLPVFYIFSNDTVWTREHFIGEEYIVVDINTEENGYMDMFLMSQCKHHIIANSSFSWWGAWLNKSDDKIVIAPAKWLNTESVKDIWCDSWIIVEG